MDLCARPLQSVIRGEPVVLVVKLQNHKEQDGFACLSELHP